MDSINTIKKAINMLIPPKLAKSAPCTGMGACEGEEEQQSNASGFINLNKTPSGADNSSSSKLGFSLPSK